MCVHVEDTCSHSRCVGFRENEAILEAILMHVHPFEVMPSYSGLVLTVRVNDTIILQTMKASNTFP